MSPHPSERNVARARDDASPGVIDRIPGGGATGAALGTAAVLAGLALANTLAARRAERDHPPMGHAVDVHGLPVHCVEGGPRGSAHPPVVLLHGNVVTLDDWLVSGVFDRIAADRRTLAFDRPGFGHTPRPRSTRWGAREQAALLRDACAREGVERPIVVAHSWATLVALAWALDAPERIAGLVLLGGYYYPTARVDAMMTAPLAAPVIGDALCHTVAPPLTKAMLEPTFKGMFAPRPVPAHMHDEFPRDLVARPVQVRAAAREGAMMVGEAEALSSRLSTLRGPIGLMAGAQDKVVDPHDQTGRLARQLSGRAGRPVEYALVPGAGHMMHHAAPDRTAGMIRLVSERAESRV